MYLFVWVAIFICPKLLAVVIGGICFDQAVSPCQRYPVNRYQSGRGWPAENVIEDRYHEIYTDIQVGLVQYRTRLGFFFSLILH